MKDEEVVLMKESDYENLIEDFYEQEFQIQYLMAEVGLLYERISPSDFDFSEDEHGRIAEEEVMERLRLEQEVKGVH